MTITFSSTPNYHTKQHNNDTPTRVNIASNYIDSRFTAGTLCNGLVLLNWIDALPAALTM
jgi:hypothetical protein